MAVVPPSCPSAILWSSCSTHLLCSGERRSSSAVPVTFSCRQRSLSEALGEIHESPPLLLLQSAISQALWKVNAVAGEEENTEGKEGGREGGETLTEAEQQVGLLSSSHTKQDCEEEAERLIQTLVWVARKHW
eukprot:746986-Hanusia_phi.AAC.3